MSTYRTLKGYSVKKVASDPSNTQRGQIWYNSTTRQIKFTGNVGGTFVIISNPTNTAKIKIVTIVISIYYSLSMSFCKIGLVIFPLSNSIEPLVISSPKSNVWSSL